MPPSLMPGGGTVVVGDGCVLARRRRSTVSDAKQGNVEAERLRESMTEPLAAKLRRMPSGPRRRAPSGSFARMPRTAANELGWHFGGASLWLSVGAARLCRRSQLRVGAEADREPTAVRRTKKMKNQRILEHGIIASRSSGLAAFLVPKN